MTDHAANAREAGNEKSVKMTLPLSGPLYAALAGDARWHERDLTEHIQRILAEYAISKGRLKGAEAKRFQMMWELVDHAVEVAKAMCREGKFTTAITLHAIQACTQDQAWAAKYREYVQDDIYKSGNPLKAPINRELGYRIKAGIGGQIVLKPDGKAASEKVLGEIIQSYTPMASYSPDSVALKADQAASRRRLSRHVVTPTVVRDAAVVVGGRDKEERPPSEERRSPL